MSEIMYVSETIHEFQKRNGGIVSTIEKRFTSNSLQYSKSTNVDKSTKVGLGYIVRLGQVDINRNTKMAKISSLLQELPASAKIVEKYPTRFCSNCKRSSWQFVEMVQSGHATCRGCGRVQHSSKANVGTLYLNDDGHSNKSMLEFTPGMDHRDTCLKKNGQRMMGGTQRPTSHLRNFWRIQKKIDGIARCWHFVAIDSLIRSGKAKLKTFYYRIHDDHADDNRRKMPHGGAALAAACFYAAVLEFEARTGNKTVCSLPAIQEQAQGEVDRSRYRRTRDVTDLVILKYAKLLQKHNLCQALVPEIGAETLQFTSTSAGLEHSRMALFGECQPVKFHLPSKESWGLQIGDTHDGVLYIDSITTDGIAFQTGLRNGDYIFQLDGQTLLSSCTPSLILKKVVALKKNTTEPQIEISIMRRKKRQ